MCQNFSLTPVWRSTRTRRRKRRIVREARKVGRKRSQQVPSTGSSQAPEHRTRTQPTTAAWCFPSWWRLGCSSRRCSASVGCEPPPPRRQTDRTMKRGGGRGRGGVQVTTAAQVKAYTQERTSLRRRTKRDNNFSGSCRALKQTLLSDSAAEEGRGDVGRGAALLCECVSHPPLLTRLNNVSHFHTLVVPVWSSCSGVIGLN